MSYVTITAGQVDADSPLDETLMDQIRLNFDAHETEKIERDGTIPMTGTFDTNGNNITLGTGDLDTEGGDVLLGGGNLNTEGGDGTFQDVTVNGTLTGVNLLTTGVGVAIKGTNTTSARPGGELTDTGKVVDFLSHLTDATHFAFVPNVSNAACYHVQTVVNADNLDLADSTSEAQNNVDYGNGNAYWLLDASGEAGVGGISEEVWVPVKEYSWAAADISDRTLSITPTLGGFQHTVILIEYNSSAPGAGTLTADYGDTTLQISTGGNDGLAMFVVLSGTNTLTLGKSGNTASATMNVYLDHGHPLAGGIS
jgi:hypothetical protein